MTFFLLKVLESFTVKAIKVIGDALPAQRESHSFIHIRTHLIAKTREW